MSSARPQQSQSPAESRGSRVGVSGSHEHYRWWALSCTSLGMLLAATNSGTLIIALPDLERSLHTSLLALVWVILAYLIAATVLVLMAGRLSDLFGRKRAYVGGFLLFALASLGAGFSPDGTVLIVWRVLQGIGSAFLFANAAALVTDAFPKEELGLAMGANTMVAAIGLVLGPVLGGALVAISWHWVFWFNVPIALAGAAWGALILRELAKPDVRARLRRARHDHVRGRAHRARAGRLARRPQRLERPDRDRRARRGGRAAAAVGADREPLARADARPEDLPQPAVRRRERRGVHQRPRPLRADVPVRLLLPGRAGQLADHGRHQADAARARDADRLAARRHLRRPPRLARARRDRDARERDRPRRR